MEATHRNLSLPTLDFASEEFPNHIYQLDKEIYALKQAPRAWYDTLASYLLGNRYKRGAIDNTMFIKNSVFNIVLTQVYVDNIIFREANEELTKDFVEVMSNKINMSMMGEL